MKPLITLADLERVPQNGELAITDDTLITPLAREEAERRGIAFRVVSAAGQKTSSGAAAADAAGEKSARTVAIGADHGGFELKEQLKEHLRDWGYGVIARNRYRVFGRHATCPLPTGETRSRFLDLD